MQSTGFLIGCHSNSAQKHGGMEKNALSPLRASVSRWFLPCMAICLLAATCSRAQSGFVDAEKALTLQYGSQWRSLPKTRISAAIVEMAESLPVGGAIDLPGSAACGELDFRRVADNVQVTGGFGGRIILGGGQQGIQLLFCSLDQSIDASIARPANRHRTPLLAAADFKNVDIFGDRTAPASDLLAMFCDGSIQIKNDVRNCAWIAGSNAFGRRTVTASARVDQSLFLWFGINWPFADYNAHLNPRNANKDWVSENAQMWFDCKGGGDGTRLYMMIETNYGNPGPGVVLQNCRNMALYQGTTERSSAQGPGVYWLKDCQNVQVGLRGINAFGRLENFPKAAVPTHDITIEGGSGNILHALRCWNHAQGATIVNSDPNLQVWMVSSQYEAQGVETEAITRFAFTPRFELPSASVIAQKRPDFRIRAEALLKARQQEINEANIAALVGQMERGRFIEASFDASAEQTFVFAGQDLTQGAAPAGRKLPPPPSMPATDAPRTRVPIAFTQQPDFGKGLLDAGADPTGAKPSDDAFARLMYGLSRAELQALLEESYKADADFRAARAKKDDQAMKAARGRFEAVVDKLHPPVNPTAKGKASRVKRPRLEVPRGTFLLNRPLVLFGWTQIWGAGPDQTTLKTTQPIKVIEQHHPGTIANLSVDGGRVGLAITGADHHDPVSPTLHAYVAGANYYNLTFRNQSFAAIHHGSDDPTIMGGAEHDQNRYIDIRCINTGDYGFFSNGSMVDKWLMLHGEFSGQKKAGIAMPFNNVIKGSVIGCKFSNIDGPGLNLLGGNPLIAYRPGIVMVDQCEFDECGSASSPAVDQGYGDLMSFTHSRITTHNKVILAGYRGSAQIYEDLQIDVKTAGGAPAMLLRAVRNGSTARPNGHTLRDIRASGAVAFINDANAHNDVFRKTMEQHGRGNEALNWDTNPAAHAAAPKNGWVHPFVIYRSQFGDRKYEYAMLNVDPAAGKVLREVDLSAMAK